VTISSLFLTVGAGLAVGPDSQGQVSKQPLPSANA
jgi:hypothetical protein